MSKSKRVGVVFLCFVVLVALTLACSEGFAATKRYTIRVGSAVYWCDSYEWVGADLKLYDCVSSDQVIIGAVNVRITDKEED